MLYETKNIIIYSTFFLLNSQMLQDNHICNDFIKCVEVIQIVGKKLMYWKLTSWVTAHTAFLQLVTFHYMHSVCHSFVCLQRSQNKVVLDVTGYGFTSTKNTPTYLILVQHRWLWRVISPRRSWTESRNSTLETKLDLLISQDILSQSFGKVTHNTFFHKSLWSLCT